MKAARLLRRGCLFDKDNWVSKLRVALGGDITFEEGERAASPSLPA